eukprot:4049939-Pyramimonas_sp.AAC.1
MRCRVPKSQDAVYTRALHTEALEIVFQMASCTHCKIRIRLRAKEKFGSRVFSRCVTLGCDYNTL